MLRTHSTSLIILDATFTPVNFMATPVSLQCICHCSRPPFIPFRARLEEEAQGARETEKNRENFRSGYVGFDLHNYRIEVLHANCDTII